MRRATTSPAPSHAVGGGIQRKFVPLFTVGFRHDYYNASDGACPDFSVSPTPDCAQLMASLGMIFRDLGVGFCVAIDQARIPAMIAYLAAHYCPDDPGRGYWTRLSFLMTLTNPGFVGFTRLPITVNPMRQNLYAGNLAATVIDKRLELGGQPGQILYPLTGASLVVAKPEGSKATLTDLSGAVPPVRSTVEGNVTTFSLASLPYGLYSVAIAGGSAGQAKSPAPSTFLYAPGEPVSFGLIDLLLTQPLPGRGEPAAFPVAAMPPPRSGAAAAPPAIAPVTLVWPFSARDTYWTYFICSHDRAAGFSPDLAVSGKGATFAKSRQQLPNGDSAVLFSSRSALPLRQVSSYRFQLVGHRLGTSGGRDSISVPWLPAAAASPVWPAPSGDVLSGSSEIYVYV